MKIASFSNNQFVDQQILDAAFGLTRDSLLDITGNLHTPGLINASALSFSYSGLNITVSAPLPFRALFSDGTLASANGTVDGESSSSATVAFSSLVPSTGSVTAYLVAVSGSVAQSPTTTVGPPVGHPDYNPSFSPYTAYSEQQDTILFQATTTEPDNLNTLFIASTVLSAGQTVITTSSTVGQVRAGAILSRNGEVLAADLGSGAAASNVGTLGGSLVGTLPNPTLAATGATSGTYINPVTITVDSDGRVSNIANVSNWNVPGNVTAGGTIVASGTISGAAATASGSMTQLSQLFIANRKAVFTANGTWTVPDFVSTIWVSGCAGGSGGGGGGGTVGSSAYIGGGGGGGGGAGQSAVKQAISVTPGHSLSIAIGAAGAGGAGGANTGTAGANGTAGGNTVLTDSTSATTLLTLVGGGSSIGGAGQGSTTAGIPNGGSGGSSGAGYPEGSYGTDGNYAGDGGEGASTPFGGGGGKGRGGDGGGPSGFSGNGYGSGGGGGGGSYASAGTGGNGGNGAPGFLVIEW